MGQWRFICCSQCISGGDIGGGEVMDCEGKEHIRNVCNWPIQKKEKKNKQTNKQWNTGKILMKITYPSGEITQ